MKKYSITGMSCAACSAKVEKAVSSLDGVESCAVNLLTNSMGVEGDVTDAEIIHAVEKAGYGASSTKNSTTKSKSSTEDEALEDNESAILKKRLISSCIFLALLMYVSMAHMMLGAPLPKAISNPLAIATTEMLISICIMFINKKFFVNGFKGAIHLSANMDTLVALGSGISFIYSLVVLYSMFSQAGAGNTDGLHKQLMNLYFESAAMIPTLITVGKLLEAKSKGKTTDALKALMKLAPKTAVILDDENNEKAVSVDEVRPGMIFVVKQGDNVPVDGKIIDGEASLDESALTGESIPRDKSKGDKVYAATTSTSGFVKCEATSVGEDTTLSAIIHMVSDVSATKAPISRIADKVSAIFVPVVIAIALITFLGWFFIFGKDFSFSIARAVTVLVISCPCALGLATPVAVMVGSGVGAKNSILYKNAQALENLGRVSVVAFDKTGTITEGKPKVTDIIPIDTDIHVLLEIAYALEVKSSHPLGKAVNTYAEENHIKLLDTQNFKTFAGNGLCAVILSESGSKKNDNLETKAIEISGGNQKYISTVTKINKEVEAKIDTLSKEGKTPLIFVYDKKIAGIIAVADTVKPDSAQAIERLENIGVKTVMITGDNEVTAKAIGELAGVSDVYAGVMPDEKAKTVEKLRESGKIAMVGDGINDAPALTTADVGIAVGSGTDIAIDSADVVLMKNSLMDVVNAVLLSKKTIKNIHENLFWAFIYNSICIPLAMGVFGLSMKPVYGALAMSLSSFCVCMNALRLNSFKTIKTEQKEEINMTKTMIIEGMMCEHCEASVKKALEGLSEVTGAEVSHKEGRAVVTLSAPVSDDILKAAVVAKDYEVKEII